jgi:hypothetical protein
MAFIHQKNYSAADERRYTQIKQKSSLKNAGQFIFYLFFSPYKHIRVHLRQIYLFLSPYKQTICVHLRSSAANLSL